MSKMNPLSKYTKIEVISVDLCSGEVFPYKKGVITSKTCGVCARSARDEMMFNNPEFLINGEAVASVINNCVENITNARDLYVPDVEQLLVAIKLATEEEVYEVSAVCPACDTAGIFERDLQYLLDTCTSLTEDVVLCMDSGLNVYFRPHTWGESNKFALKAYQIRQQITSLEADTELTDEKKIEFISPLVDGIARLQYDSSLCHIAKVETPEERDNIITDPKIIREWMETLKSADFKMIMEKVKEVMDFGISHEMDCECTCGHKWVMKDLKMDPSTFFAPRS